MVNEASNMGGKGPIFRNEEITITESISGRQNMEREMLVELREPSINIPIPLLKEIEIMEEGKFQKIDYIILVIKGSSNERDILLETGNSLKGTWVVVKGPSLVDGVRGLRGVQ